MIVIDRSVVVMEIYLALFAVFFFAAWYTAAIWREVGGLRGLAMLILFAGLALICSASAWLHGDYDALISVDVIVIILRWFWLPVALAALVMADLYAADHNDHRSLTTRSYLWFKRLGKTRGEHARQKREASAARSGR